MKWRTNLLVSIAMLAFCLSIVSLSAQFITNPGFENGINSWTDNGSGTEAASSTNVRTGSGSMSYITTSTSNQDMRSSTTISVPNINYVHVIGWAIGNNTLSRASVGTFMGSLSASTSYLTIGTTRTQLTYSGQNTQGSTQTALIKLNSRSATSESSTTLYWDDTVIYTSSSGTIDLTVPTTPSGFTNGTITANSIGFSWTNGTDAGTGVQKVIILRTTNMSAITPSLNNQGQFSTGGGTSGPNTIGDWTIVSIDNVGTTFTNNGLTASTNYKYAIIDMDLAANYSTALVSGQITTSSGSTPTITVTGTLTAFSTVTGTASNYQSYKVSGADLTDDISVNAPTNFEICKTSDGSYGNTLTYAQSGSAVAEQDVFVRIAASAPSGSVSGNVSHASTDAATVNKAVSGTVYKIEPTNHVTSFAAGTTTPYTIPLTWIDAVAGSQAPDGYLIRGSSVGYGSIVVSRQALIVLLNFLWILSKEKYHNFGKLDETLSNTRITENERET